MAIVTAVALVGCNGKPTPDVKPPVKPGPEAGIQKLDRPKLFITFGDDCNVPDGMSLDKDNNIILSVPNYMHKVYVGEIDSVPADVNMTHPGKLVKLTIKDGKPEASTFFMLPPHPETKLVHPMGLEHGPDGNIYIADNQYFKSKDYKSRLLKVIVEDGKAVDCKVVVDGIKLANAVRWKGNDCYVSDTFFDVPGKHLSGIWKFSLDEMNKGPVHVQNSKDDPMVLTKDPHLFALITSRDVGDEQTAGADGVCFDSKGALYTGGFGDGRITKVTVGADGKPKTEIILDDEKLLPCCDGIVCDTKTDEIFITNSKQNAIHILDAKTNKIRKVWENDDDDGRDGLLDQPCEPLLRGNQLIIVNFDFTFPGLKNSKNDEYHTLSVFDLK
jgi:sugar lactone lactonase YvrE